MFPISRDLCWQAATCFLRLLCPAKRAERFKIPLRPRRISGWLRRASPQNGGLSSALQSFCKPINVAGATQIGYASRNSPSRVNKVGFVFMRRLISCTPFRPLPSRNPLSSMSTDARSGRPSHRFARLFHLNLKRKNVNSVINDTRRPPPLLRFAISANGAHLFC